MVPGAGLHVGALGVTGFAFVEEANLHISRQFSLLEFLACEVFGFLVVHSHIKNFVCEACPSYPVI